jgi:hypothetical protein
MNSAWIAWMNKIGFYAALGEKKPFRGTNRSKKIVIDGAQLGCAFVSDEV